MDSLIGADPDGLETLARRVRTTAERFDIVRGEVASALAHLGWQGEDADGFREEWGMRLSGRLGMAIDMLNAAASALDLNAAQQRWASGEFGAGGGGLPWSVLAGLGLGGAQFMMTRLAWVADAKAPFDLAGFLARHAPSEVEALKNEFPGITRSIAGLKSMNPVERLARYSKDFERLGGPLAAVGAVVDVVGLRQKPSADTEVDLALSVAAVAVAFIPGPDLVEGGVFAALGVAKGTVTALNIAYSVGGMVDPHLGDQIVSISNTVANDVGNAERSAGQAVLAAGAADLHAAGAASRIVTGGVESMVRHLHF